MTRAITAIENGYLNLDPIITHVCPIEEINECMHLLMEGKGMEIILTF
jgi:Zn-dependent alcohol dehydrogenase